MISAPADLLSTLLFEDPANPALMASQTPPFSSFSSWEKVSNALRRGEGENVIRHITEIGFD